MPIAPGKEGLQVRISSLKTILCLLASAAVLRAASVHGAVLYVDDSSTSGLNNGSSWSDAFTDLQDALSAATNGTEVWVAAGIYTPAGTNGPRTASFQLQTGVALYGGFAGNETALENRDVNSNASILSGDLNGDDVGTAGRTENSYQVVNGSGCDPSAILDGFTIVAGNADGAYPYQNGAGIYNSTGSPTVAQCTFLSNAAVNHGGGMFNGFSSSPLVTSCSFIGNAAHRGGGIFNFSDSNPTVADCLFQANPGQRNGGGICNRDHCSPQVTGCSFVGNSSDRGGGIYNFLFSSPSVEGCSFVDNLARDQGGGIYSRDSSAAVITGCTFVGNSADRGGAMYARAFSDTTLADCTITGNGATRGGAVFIELNTSVGATNCGFSGNAATEYGGGIFSFGSNGAALVNCSFSGNTALEGQALAGDAITLQNQNTFTLVNCIVWDQGNEIWSANGSAVSITFSDVYGGWSGKGNINADPRFADSNGADNLAGTADDDLHLLSDSPCVNAGKNGAAALLPTDFDGQARVQQCRVDIGLDETPYFNDCDSSGIADACEIAAGTSADCNGNAVPDECDVAGGASVDADGNGIPDECVPCVAPVGSGDADTNGFIDMEDFIVLEACLSGPQTAAAVGCEMMDMDGDCSVDLADFALFQRAFGTPTGPAP